MQVVILSKDTPGLALKTYRKLPQALIYPSASNSFTKALYKRLKIPLWNGFTSETCFIEAGVTEIPTKEALITDVKLNWGEEKLEALLAAKVKEYFSFDSYETLKVSLSRLNLDKEFTVFERTKDEERALRKELIEQEDIVSILIPSPEKGLLELLGTINNLKETNFEVLLGGASSLIESLKLPFSVRVIEGADLNELAAFSKGRYLLPLKSTDLIFPDALGELLKSSAEVVFSDYVVIESEPRYFAPSKEFIPNSVPILLSKEAWLLAEGFDIERLNKLRVSKGKIHKPLFTTKAEAKAYKNYDAKISVIIPSFGRDEFLSRAVKSVLEQTFENFEVIIITTDEVSFSDSRIRVLNPGSQLPVSVARNFGLKAARGDFIAYLDDDDYYLPHHLETLLSVAQTTDVSLVYSLGARVWERGVNDLPLHYDLPFSQDVDWFSLLFGGKFPTLTVLHKRSSELFDENLECMEDWDYWLRVGKSIRHIPEITCCYSRRPERDGLSSSRAELFHWYAFPIWAKHLTKDLPQELKPHFEALLNEHSRQILSMKGSLPLHKEYINQSIDSLFIRSDLKHALKVKLGGHSASFSPPRKDLVRDLVSIVIPLYNGLPYTKELFQSLLAHPSKYKTEIIFVDNASSDGTQEFLKSCGVKSILNDENRNFAGACNQGAYAATGEFVVFLNNDTIVFNDWLSPLIDELKDHPETGAVGNKQIFPGTKRIHHAGIYIDLYLHPKHYLEGVLESDPRVNKRRTMTCVTGACLAMRTEEFLSLGGFDEVYRNGYEDNDLCLKVLASGKQVVYRPDSVIYHHVSKSAGRTTHSGENWRIFISRWGSSLRPDLKSFLS